MPGQCPGECGRRIARRDACPTQKGGHPPQRGVSAVPSPGTPLVPFGSKCTCSHCGQMCGRVYPALFSNPLCCTCPGHFAEVQRGKTGGCQGQNVSPGGWAISQSLGVSSVLLMNFQGVTPRLGFDRPFSRHSISGLCELQRRTARSYGIFWCRPEWPS